MIHRAKLVSQYIYTNQQMKEIFEKLVPKELQDLLKFSNNKDYI